MVSHRFDCCIENCEANMQFNVLHFFCHNIIGVTKLLYIHRWSKYTGICVDGYVLGKCPVKYSCDICLETAIHSLFWIKENNSKFTGRDGKFADLAVPPQNSTDYLLSTFKKYFENT